MNLTLLIWKAHIISWRKFQTGERRLLMVQKMHSTGYWNQLKTKRIVLKMSISIIPMMILFIKTIYKLTDMFPDV